MSKHTPPPAPMSSRVLVNVSDSPTVPHGLHLRRHANWLWLIACVGIVGWFIYYQATLPPRIATSVGDSSAYQDAGRGAGGNAASDLKAGGAGKMTSANLQILATQVAKNRGIVGADAQSFVAGYVQGYNESWSATSR